MAGSGPLRTLLGAGRLGPEGKARAAEPGGPPPGLSSLSSPSPLCSFSLSSAVLLEPWHSQKNPQGEQYNAHLNYTAKKKKRLNNIQISACSSQTHSRMKIPVCGRDSWTAVSGTSSQVCHQTGESGRSSCRLKIQLEMYLKKRTELIEKFDLIWFSSCLLTWIALAKNLNGGWHLFLTDSLILLSFSSCFEALPGQRTQVKVHKNIAKGLEIVPSRLLCGNRR